MEGGAGEDCNSASRHATRTLNEAPRRDEWRVEEDPVNIQHRGLRAEIKKVEDAVIKRVPVNVGRMDLREVFTHRAHHMQFTTAGFPRALQLERLTVLGLQ